MAMPFMLWEEFLYFIVISFLFSCKKMSEVNAKRTASFFYQPRNFFHRTKDIYFPHCFWGNLYLPSFFFYCFHHLFNAFFYYPITFLSVFFRFPLICIKSGMKYDYFCP